MSDDEFPEGSADSEAADAPETDVPRGSDAKQGGIDSSSTTDAPVQRTNRAAHRTQAARKAFAEAIVTRKAEAANKPPTEVDDLDPEAPMIPEAKPLAALADIAKAKAAAADAPAAEAAKPPAPSLDPEVRQMREAAKREREQLAADRAEFEKSKAKPEAVALAATPSQVPDLESYIDNAPSWLRNTFEAMRADKMSDEEFKSEVADLITMLSGDVLGVPLPENVRIKLEAAQAKKMVRTHKTIMSRKEAEATARAEKERVSATEKQETERVEQEWGKAASSLSDQFRHVADADGKPQDSAAMKAYPWLAAEDNPGHAIVDVIRATFTRDGTQLSWQEAAKQANDYLKTEAEKYYGKRSALLGGVKPAAAVAKPVVAAAPVAAVAKSAVITTPGGNQKWSRERQMENTRAAFRAALASKTQ